MRKLAAFLIPAFCAMASPAMAQAIVYEEIVTEEFVVAEAGDESAEVAFLRATGSERFVETQDAAAGGDVAGFPGVPQHIAAYGPFRVLDDTRAALVDVTDAGSPAAFAAMLRDHPGIAELQLIECPGTFDDVANLKLGRMIRARGLATHVPRGGSVRSGAVELFLAGSRRLIDEGAEFAVHAWLDEDGRQAGDYAVSDPENQKYLAYYREMGMSASAARAFYAMTNSAPFESALWLDAGAMRRWVGGDGAAPAAAPVRLAGLDSGQRLQ